MLNQLSPCSRPLIARHSAVRKSLRPNGCRTARRPVRLTSRCDFAKLTEQLPFPSSAWALNA